MADAQDAQDVRVKGGTKVDPCDPSYVPKKNEAPPTCQGVKALPLEPAKGAQSLAPTLPPVAKKKPARAPGRAPETAVVNNPGFRATRDGGSKVYVQIHGVPAVQQYGTRSGVTYVLTDARVPVLNNRHPLMTQYFNTPIADARLSQVAKNVQFRIDLRAPAVPTPRLVELVPGKVVLLEVSFPPGNYHRDIPTSVPHRIRGGKGSHSGAEPPPGGRGNRSTPPPNTGTSVLGPIAP